MSACFLCRGASRVETINEPGGCGNGLPNERLITGLEATGVWNV